MSKATTGLRRAGIGGLAAVVAAGTALIGAGSAFALGTGGAISTTPSTTMVTTDGTTVNTLGSIDIGMANSFSAGDTISVRVSAPGGTCANLSTSVNITAAGTPAADTVKWSTTPLGTTAPATVPTVEPSFNAPTLSSSSSACAATGAKDVATWTIANTSSGDATAFYNFTISGLKATFGTGITAGNVVATVTGTSGGTTPVAAFSPNSGTVAYVAGVTGAASSVRSIQSTSTNVAMGNLVYTEGAPASVPTGAYTLTLTNGKWNTTTTKPTVTVTSGDATITAAASASGNTLTFSVGQSVSKASTFTVSGLSVDANGTAGSLVTVSGTSPLPTVTFGSIVNQGRIGGSDRYYTAAQLFNKAVSNWASAHSTLTANVTAVIANGYAYPDALSANVAVGAIDAKAPTPATTPTTGYVAGVLLTGTNSLPTATANALRSNNVGNVVVVGGTGVVSDAVVKAIQAITTTAAPNGIVVTRIGGATRYSTNELVNEFYGKGTAATAVVATGQDFADALSVGPAVVSGNYNLVLTAPTALSPEASATFQNLGLTNAIIVGGTGAVSTAAATSLTNLGVNIVTRLAGATRYGTAVAIANWETTATTATPVAGLGFDAMGTAHLATGTNFADALAAAAVAGPAMQVILLTNPTSLSTETGAYIKGLTTTSATLATVNALGLGGAVSPAVLQAAADATVK